MDGKVFDNSNTTLVKVKFQLLGILNGLITIQIQLLLKLNIYKPARDLETDEFKYNSC